MINLSHCDQWPLSGLLHHEWQFYGLLMRVSMVLVTTMALLNRPRESYVELALRNSLAGVKVSDLMIEDYPTVDGRENIQDFVDHALLRT
jgi:hypothetical protein